MRRTLLAGSWATCLLGRQAPGPFSRSGRVHSMPSEPWSSTDVHAVAARGESDDGGAASVDPPVATVRGTRRGPEGEVSTRAGADRVDGRVSPGQGASLQEHRRSGDGDVDGAGRVGRGAG